VTAPPPSPPLTYKQLLEDIEKDRAALAEKYDNSSDKSAVIAEARARFVMAVKDIAPYWYGTKWDFNGITETPGKGKIACGYFVVTVMRDAGLDVERVRLSRQASERIIKSLTSERHMRRFSNIPVREFVRRVAQNGDGIYVVGLDKHVGMVFCEGGIASFVHSSGLSPWCVVSESALTSPALVRSRYRVYGHISADDDLMVRWLKKEHIPTR
jgi:hypothetical protein